MSITDERKKTIDFTEMYYDTPTVLIGAKNGDTDITPEHLKGKTIGVQVSTIHERYVQKYYGANSEIKTYQTQDEANNDLASGRLDYVQADGTALDAYLKTDQGKECCEFKGRVPEDPEILGHGVGGGVRKEDTELRDKLSKAIKDLADSGEIAKITENYPDLKSARSSCRSKHCRSAASRRSWRRGRLLARGAGMEKPGFLELLACRRSGLWG